MMLNLRIPKTLLWVLNLLVLFLLLLTSLRLAMVVAFMPQGGSIAELMPSFWLGFRFDLRWACLLLLPIVAVSTVPQLSPYHSQTSKRFWTWYLAISSFFVVLIYTIDFGCFAYYRVRLGATVLNFADDAAIGAAMLWESYPIVWAMLGLVLLVLSLRFIFRYMHQTVAVKNNEQALPNKRRWFVATSLFFALLIYGSFPLPLQLNHAFGMKNDFSGYVALNPLQTVYSTLQNRQPQFDSAKTAAAFPVMKDWMGWPGGNAYKRIETPVSPYFNSKPNVVLVMCESFSMYKTSMSGNRLDATPYFDQLSKQGLFFNRCFTPHFSTARGMFATITGIPDVQLAKFSTRTQAAQNQHTIINNFEGYKKFYFLGGDPAFNNFEGLLRNVNGVQLFTEGAFGAQPIDVWGISDKNLFLEANKVFTQQTQPFFAVIQSSDNHPPYTIAPDDTTDFKVKQRDEGELEQWGFESAAQYNALRYFDWSVEKFMKAAENQPWFANTLFVFVGDHGVAGNARSVYQQEWTDNRLTEMHVPLLFYAPGHVAPSLHTETVSQVDVLPTIAVMTGQRHTNSTLGRNLLQKNNHSAFFIRHDEGEIGLVTDDFYFTKNILFEKEKLQLLNAKAVYTKPQRDSMQRRFSAVASGYLETARWMLMNNKQFPCPPKGET